MRDNPLLDGVPEMLELGDPEGGTLHKPWAIPSGPQDSTGVELVSGGTVTRGCVDETTPGNDKGSCDVCSGCGGDDDPGELGVELGLVEQRPKDRPKGPQGSIGGEDDGAGEGDDDWSFGGGEVTTGWDVAAGCVGEDCTFVALPGTDDWGITQAPSMITAGATQTIGEGVGVFDGGWEDGGGCCGDEDGAGVALSGGEEGLDDEGRTQTPLMRIEGDKQTTGEGEEGFDDEGGGCEDGGGSDCGTLVDGKLGADVDESGVEGVEVGAGVDCAGVCVGVSDELLAGGDDAGGKTQLPARSKPSGQLTVGEEDEDSGCGADEGLVGTGGFEVAGSEEGEGEDGSLVDGGDEGVGEVEGGSVVEGGSGVEEGAEVVCGGLDVDGGSVVEGSVEEG